MKRTLLIVAFLFSIPVLAQPAPAKPKAALASMSVQELMTAAQQGNTDAQMRLGVIANQAGYPDQALTWYRMAADQGIPEAQLLVGFMYLGDSGVAADLPESVKWFRKSAEQGYARAQTFLGSAYAAGTGVAPDMAQAARWYRKAADQGEPFAQAKLGRAYLGGHGVLQDYTEAAKWLRKAAVQGIDEAQVGLALLYDAGMGGVPKDPVLAYAWMNLAAAQGEEDGKKYRDAVLKELSPAQIAEAQELSRNWKKGQALQRKKP